MPRSFATARRSSSISSCDYGEMAYPGLSDFFPAATRMQRAATDLTGVAAIDADTRPWLRHSAWPREYKPLAPRSIDYAGDGTPPPDDYPFVRSSGDGVHEIPVGPVHAGIIEPGHFRFSIVGEKVLKLEERLGYAHKGIERLFARTKLEKAHRLAARVSGDSAVAFSWAYCQALEGLARCEVPERARLAARARLELERIANHLGDLGALGNDAGFAFGLAQFSRLKEIWLRAVDSAIGQRYLIDFVVPGGVARDARDDLLRRSATRRACSAPRPRRCARSTTSTPACSDRFVGAGAVAPDLAARLGLIGLAGRASGQALDLRVDLPCAPYAELEPAKSVPRRGRRGGACRRALRRADRVATARARDRRAVAAGRAVGRLAAGRGGRARHRARRRLARSRARRARCGPGRRTCAAAIRTILRGRTGPCSSTRSSATSFRTFR